MDKTIRDKLFKLADGDLARCAYITLIVSLLLTVVVPTILCVLSSKAGADREVLRKWLAISLAAGFLSFLYGGNLLDCFGLCHGTRKGVIAFTKYHLDGRDYYLCLLSAKDFECKAKSLSGELNGVVNLRDEELKAGYDVSKEYRYWAGEDAYIYMNHDEFDNLYSLVKARRDSTFLALSEEEYLGFEEAYKNGKRIELTGYSVLI